MVEGVAFSPDGKTLAMASREANVQLWDVATGKLLETLKGHSSAGPGRGVFAGWSHPGVGRQLTRRFASGMLRRGGN